MCVKEINKYVQCGCQDTIVHIRTCANKLLKDDFDGGYGYSRCSTANQQGTLNTPMQGWCPRCAVNKLVVKNDKLAVLPDNVKKMAPVTLLPKTGKKDKLR